MNFKRLVCERSYKEIQSLKFDNENFLPIILACFVSCLSTDNADRMVVIECFL